MWYGVVGGIATSRRTSHSKPHAAHSAAHNIPAATQLPTESCCTCSRACLGRVQTVCVVVMHVLCAEHSCARHHSACGRHEPHVDKVLTVVTGCWLRQQHQMILILSKLQAAHPGFTTHSPTLFNSRPCSHSGPTCMHAQSAEFQQQSPAAHCMQHESSTRPSRRALHGETCHGVSVHRRFAPVPRCQANLHAAICMPAMLRLRTYTTATALAEKIL